MPTRLYRVKLKAVPASSHTVRLIEASNPAQARSHVAQRYFEVDIPSPLEAAQLVREGVGIERAGVETDEQKAHQERREGLKPAPIPPPPTQPAPPPDQVVGAAPVTAGFFGPSAYENAFKPSEEVIEQERAIRESPEVQQAMKAAAERARQQELAGAMTEMEALRPGMAAQAAKSFEKEGLGQPVVG